jgi:hypothetical protein
MKQDRCLWHRLDKFKGNRNARQHRHHNPTGREHTNNVEKASPSTPPLAQGRLVISPVSQQLAGHKPNEQSCDHRPWGIFQPVRRIAPNPVVNKPPNQCDAHQRGAASTVGQFCSRFGLHTQGCQRMTLGQSGKPNESRRDRSSSGSLAMLTAMRRASSTVSDCDPTPCGVFSPYTCASVWPAASLTRQPPRKPAHCRPSPHLSWGLFHVF